MVKIFIDPGHGGRDPGATANGLQEKDICLTIALKLQDVLKRNYVGHHVTLSRTQDQTLSLKARTDMANSWGADYLVSIHVNAGGGTGFESYIYNGQYGEKRITNQLRAIIHGAVVQASGFRDRGKKEANFHMLRESLMPAVLTENGFIDTIADANLLQDPTFLNEIATAHARGIAQALKLRKNNVKQESADNHEQKVHVIKRGDTLWSLARHYGTTVDKLRKWNGSVIPELLQIGAELVVSKGNAQSMYHTIVKGDTLWGLGVKYGKTVNQLLEFNGSIDPKRLRIGDQVRVG